jgi:hypothetical protein
MPGWRIRYLSTCAEANRAHLQISMSTRCQEALPDGTIAKVDAQRGNGLYDPRPRTGQVPAALEGIYLFCIQRQIQYLMQRRRVCRECARWHLCGPGLKQPSAYLIACFKATQFYVSQRRLGACCVLQHGCVPICHDLALFCVLHSTGTPAQDPDPPRHSFATNHVCGKTCWFVHECACGTWDGITGFLDGWTMLVGICSVLWSGIVSCNTNNNKVQVLLGNKSSR